MNVQEAHIAFDLLLDKGGSLSYPDFLPEEKDFFINKATLRIVKNKLTGKSSNPLRKDSVEETEKRINDLRLLTEDYRISPLDRDVNKNKPYGNFVILPDHFLYLLDEVVDIREYDCHGLITDYNDVEVKKTTHDKYNRMIKDPFNKPNLNRVLKLPFGYYNQMVNTNIMVNIDFTAIGTLFTFGTALNLGSILIGDILSTGHGLFTIITVILDEPREKIVGFTALNPNKIPGGKILNINRQVLTTSEVEEIISVGEIKEYKMRYIRYPRLLDYTLYNNNDPNTKIIDSPSGSYNTNIIELTDQVCDEVIDEAVTMALEVIESKRYQSNSYENNKVS